MGYDRTEVKVWYVKVKVKEIFTMIFVFHPPVRECS
jgi:hypothetical protein